MKKNNKGFTLVELLAAIVILGILIGVSVPIIVSLLDTSRNKIYINDAKKLITQAEYKLKANSSDIEKPDEGDCIAVSMVYLDSADFDNPPNEGKYEKESSFVIIKNNGGKLEYSVTIVEKVKKGGYKGVELVSRSELSSSNALSHVVNFKESEIVNVETDVNRSYINNKLGDNYISNENNITAIYNYPDLSDSSSNTDITGTPRITFASLISASSKGYNSLDATLQLKVDDKDTPRRNLKIYLAVDSGYESATTPIDYGDNDTFSYNINFGNYGKVYDGSNVKLYIIVKDPEDNTTKKTMTYKIHKNVVPEIDDASSIKKRSSDSKNMTTALVDLSVSDDIDTFDSLSVCLKESSTDEDFNSCDNYQNYYSYFGESNTMEYTFTNCSGGCRRDGSTHYLTVFVKDSLGGISKKKMSYTFSTNTAPEIKSVNIDSQVESFTTDRSRTILVRVNATDDVDNGDHLSVKVSDGISEAVYNYSNQPIYYTINGTYDGSTKNIKVKVVDSEGGVSEENQNYTVYQNKAPEIKSFKVVSSATVCNNQALCPPEEGGNKIVNIDLDASDDIDYDGLSVCISTTNSCSNYVSYSNYDNKTPQFEIPGDYDGSTKTIYAFVKDSYGQITTDSKTYKVYKNQAPYIEYFTMSSKTDGIPANDSLNAIFRIEAYDDFDSTSDLKIRIKENGVTKINLESLDNYLDKDNDYTLSGGYDGEDRTIVVEVVDKDSLVASKTIQYSVYEDSGPTVDSFNVYSKEMPCINSIYCEEKGNYNAYYSLAIHDDIDNKEDLQVCISNTNSCSNYSSYSNYYDGNGNAKEFSYTFSVADSNKPYDGSIKHLYLFAKDSNNNVTSEEVTYALYENKAPTIIGDASIEVYPGEAILNVPSISYTVIAEDDLDDDLQVKYCYKLNSDLEHCTEYEDYNETKVLNKTFFNSSRPNGEEYRVYAKIKDSYGRETSTDELEYKLYVDSDPEISYVGIDSGVTKYKDSSSNVIDSLDEVSDPENYSPFTRLKITFSVDDPYDTFSVCVSKNSTTCNNYSNAYKANLCIRNEETSEVECEESRFAYSINYDLDNEVQDGDTIQLYLFAKDSYDVKTHKIIYDKEYVKCQEYDEEDAVFTYTFNETETVNNTSSNQPISIDRCEGKCYSYNSATEEENNIVAFYDRKIAYTDKFKSNEFCPSLEDPSYTVKDSYRASCDFKDCFYKNNNYNRYSIGTNLYTDDEPWTLTVGDTLYTCTGHYNLYLSSYVEGKREITLTKTNTNICKEAFDDHVYDYDSSSSNPYVIIND